MATSSELAVAVSRPGPGLRAGLRRATGTEMWPEVEVQQRYTIDQTFHTQIYPYITLHRKKTPHYLFGRRSEREAAFLFT